jgi:hypothetical protein
MREGRIVKEFSRDEAEPEKVMKVLAAGENMTGGGAA